MKLAAFIALYFVFIVILARVMAFNEIKDDE